MANATLKISSPDFANPIIVPVANFEFGLPGNADLKITAHSAVGTVTPTEEDIVLDLSIEGYPIVAGKKVAEFPVNIAGAVGEVVASLIKSVDATITFEATVGAPPVA